MNNDLVPKISISSTIFRKLRNKYHSWCIDNNIWYDLEQDEYYQEQYLIRKYYLIFKDKSDAILFKLTWMGI